MVVHDSNNADAPEHRPLGALRMCVTMKMLVGVYVFEHVCSPPIASKSLHVTTFLILGSRLIATCFGGVYFIGSQEASSIF